MGEHNISPEVSVENAGRFMRELLSDLHVVEQMMEQEVFDPVCRLGAEQEFVFVDENRKPVCLIARILPELNDHRFTTELGKFNMEANLTPVELQGKCLTRMENELNELVSKASVVARNHDADVLLTGIIPTIGLNDLTLEQMTDLPRYHQLNQVLTQLRRSNFYAYIKGLDEIHITHDSMMLEACNTSFQVHFQVHPNMFADSYNTAQVISAPVLAAAVNSPLLFGKRLWAETRIALLQHSVDERSPGNQIRDRLPRVDFGDRWVRNSILEIWKQDIARFRILLTAECEEDPIEEFAHGRIPKLNALRIHNGTVWRWNRPCYGILNRKPHLRIEFRALPAGPTVLDQIANAAFQLGLMCSIRDAYGPVDQVFSFDDVRANFYAAARHGLDAQLHWVNGKCIPAPRLILDELLPLARFGLLQHKVDRDDVDRYLGIIQERVTSEQTGARWIMQSYNRSEDLETREIRLRVLTSKMLALQNSGKAVHEWPIASEKPVPVYRMDYKTVGQFMSTSLYTVRPDDIIDYIASIMHWQHIRHVPVEDHLGNLVGLVAQRDLLVLLAQGSTLNRAPSTTVRSIMKTDVIHITPETRTVDAIELMRKNKIGCLPVCREGKLVGILTTYDLLSAATHLLEKALSSA